nr:Ycf37 [Erythrocladia irregularis]
MILSFGLTYLGILLLFLIFCSYYITIGIINNIQEENLYKLINQLKKSKEDEHILHLKLAKLYIYKKIIDAGIYELRYLILHNYYSNQELSNLYCLIGKGYEEIDQTTNAIKEYTRALEIFDNNLLAKEQLTRIIRND